MAFQYDMDKIFAELEKKARKKQREKLKQDNPKENNPIESPEDAPKTQEVAPATSKTTEDTHGGDEASKEIKDSPNSVNGGENDSKETKSEKTENSGEKGKGDGQGEDEKKKDIKSKDTGDKGEGHGHGGKKEKEKKDNSKKATQENDDYFITSDASHPSKTKPRTTPEELEAKATEIFEKKRKKQDDFKTQHREEYLKKYMLGIIKKIAAQHAGIDKQAGSETYDKKQMLEHIVKKQNYKLLGDKYDLRDTRYVQFFIDTSGVYGCGSNKILHELMPQLISMLEKQGYECYIAACGNGFYSRDMVEDEYYGTRKTLEGYKTGKVSKIACPTPQTAAKMANETEFSIILADFDGLSSICEMASLCQKDKIPYFLSTEDRYPWEDPTLHDWVDPDMCEYTSELVFDVSMDGNPSLTQYEDLQNDYDQDYDDYEQDDGYEYDDN